MKIRTRWMLSLWLIVAPVLSVAVIGNGAGRAMAAEPAPGPTPFVQDRDRPRGEEAALRERIGEVEARLAELEALTNQARQRGDEQRVRDLSREAEEIRDTLRELGRADREERRDERVRDERVRDERLGDEERGDRREETREREQREQEERLVAEREEREVHRHRMQLELERAELESSFGRLEMVGQIARVAETDVSSAAFAVMHVERFMELPEAVEFLQDMLEQSKNDAVRRMIRIRLLELNAGLDRRDDVRTQLKHLILGDE